MYEITISSNGSADVLSALYSESFPDEDLVPLVLQLAAGKGGAIAFSAHANDELVANFFITPCRSGDSGLWYLLGPVAVLPEHQGKGVGTKMIKKALEVAEANKAIGMLVLGDPGFYSRSGFTCERRVAPPHDLPNEWADAWQSVRFSKANSGTSRLVVPDVWADKSLWLP